MFKSLTKIKPSQYLAYAPAILFLVVLNILILTILFFLRKSLPPEIPLLYGMPNGEDQLASSLFISIPTLVSLIVIFINSLLIKVVKDTFLQQILIGLAASATLLSTITTIKIVLMVRHF